MLIFVVVSIFVFIFVIVFAELGGLSQPLSEHPVFLLKPLLPLYLSTVHTRPTALVGRIILIVMLMLIFTHSLSPNLFGGLDHLDVNVNPTSLSHLIGLLFQAPGHRLFWRGHTSSGSVRR